RVRLFDCGNRIAVFTISISKGQELVCLLYSIPPFIAVHRIVTADYACYSSRANRTGFLDKLCDITGSALRRCVATVKKTMDEYFFQTMFTSHIQQRVKVSIHAVDSAVRNQSHQMQCTVVILGVFDCAEKGRILKKCSILNCHIDARYIHLNDSA